MEHAELGSLRQFIRSGNSLTIDDYRETASCCLLGLESLHTKGVIHGVHSTKEDNGLECESRQSVPM